MTDTKTLWKRPESPLRLSKATRTSREALADRAVDVLHRLGVAVTREPFGFRGGEGVKTWFVTLADLGRYLLIVRDVEHQQLVILPRRTPVEIQRTINTLGVDEEGWHVEEKPEAVIDLEEDRYIPVLPPNS